MSPSLSFTMFPHIFDDILRSASFEALRATSRHMRNVADRFLGRHLIIAPCGMIITPLGLPPVYRPQRTTGRCRPSIMFVPDRKEPNHFQRAAVQDWPYPPAITGPKFEQHLPYLPSKTMRLWAAAKSVHSMDYEFALRPSEVVVAFGWAPPARNLQLLHRFAGTSFNDLQPANCTSLLRAAYGNCKPQLKKVVVHLDLAKPWPPLSDAWFQRRRGWWTQDLVLIVRNSGHSATGWEECVDDLRGLVEEQSFRKAGQTRVIGVGRHCQELLRKPFSRFHRVKLQTLHEYRQSFNGDEEQFLLETDDTYTL